MRLFLGLNDKDPDNGLYFADFADRLALKQVIVGHLSKVEVLPAYRAHATMVGAGDALTS
jgi:hypothetical protein